MRHGTAALCAVVLVGQFLLGCGNGDDRPAGRADYVDALTEDLREPEGGVALDEKPARCLAETDDVSTAGSRGSARHEVTRANML
jgi:hypothetical protein